MELRVTSTDYKYEGIPRNLASDAIVVTFINLGAEPHEMNVFQIDDSESRPFQELISLPQAERDQALTPTGSISANPGSTDTQLIKLLPGRYAIACLNPQGSTAAQDGTGPPHATLGEAVEFNVQ
jgi:hypothetical protein